MNDNDSMEFKVKPRLQPGKGYQSDQIPITVEFKAEQSKPADAGENDQIAKAGVDFELGNNESVVEYGSAVVKIKVLGPDKDHPHRNERQQPNKWFRLKIASVTPDFVKPARAESQIDIKIEDHRKTGNDR